MVEEQSGERTLQREMDSVGRADRFYQRQMRTALNDKMKNLIRLQEMVFIATADAAGNCDCSPRFGPPGFVHVVNDEVVAFPDYRGNGVFASLGNIVENPHIGLVFVDFFDTTVGLHVNGSACSYSLDQVPDIYHESLQPVTQASGRAIERWVIVTIDEAYIHCSKHVPQLQKLGKAIDWGTDDPVVKKSAYFLENS